MDPKLPQKSYKKRYFIGGAIFILVILIFGNSNSDSQTTQSNQYASPVDTGQPVQPVQTESNLSNDNYYTNSVGAEVHSPAYSDTIPVGATAQCRDGTYSFSQSRRGTCSHHGGVAEWL